MMPIRTLALGAALAALLAACSAPAPTHDKAYYLANSDDRAKTLAACRGDPGRLGNTPNCVNAAAAAGEVESQRFWTVKKPPSRVANPNSL
ncbi:MAG: EexN family lipoprotein [Caulobacteraceae bacterium]|nr:EexN family lipoprotein [Caulobacteraceae bacterium]